VAYDLYEARPGMTVIDYIKPLKKWILVHELPIGNSSSYGVNYPVRPNPPFKKKKENSPLSD
jgi:hypothetical protein